MLINCMIPIILTNNTLILTNNTLILTNDTLILTNDTTNKVSLDTSI